LFCKSVSVSGLRSLESDSCSSSLNERCNHHKIRYTKIKLHKIWSNNIGQMNNNNKYKKWTINYLSVMIICWWDKVVLKSEASDPETSGLVVSCSLIPCKRVCFNSIAMSVKILKHNMHQQQKLTAEVSLIHPGNLSERRLIYCSIATSGFMFPSFCQAFLAQRKQYCRSLIQSSSQPCYFN